MTTSTSRRRVLWVGGAAAAAGLGVSLWRAWPAASPAGAAEGATAHLDPAAEFWGMHFKQPDGRDLAMAGFRGKPLLLNFWATWCPPCIREMPDIDRFARQFAPIGWQVLGLAVDQDKPVREFLSRNPVGYPIALAGFEGIALSRALGNTAGALPFTVSFDAAGRPVNRHLGQTQFDLLAKWGAEPERRQTPP